MKKYMIVFDAKTSRGGQTIGNMAMELESLTMEAIVEIQAMIIEDHANVISAIVTNVIELEG